MKTTLRIKRGLKASLSAVDATKIGELSYCTDTHELFINNGSAYALLNDFSQYYDKTGINALLSALVSKSDVNSDYATEIDYSIVGDTIQVKQYYKNISTGATKEVSKTIPLASTTNAGLMAKEDTIALAKAISDISALNNKVLRYPVKLSSTNPSQTELNSTFISASGKAITDILDGTTMIDYDNGFLAYTYFSFSQPNHWLARGVDTVTIGTNTAPGIVQGSEDVGKVYIETDSTMSVVGFDALSTQVDNNTNKLESIEDNAQVNVLESISVNGTLQTIANKGVNLSVPTQPSDIGLSNVDNTSDIDKPLSTATTNSLILKLDTPTALASGTDLNTITTAGLYYSAVNTSGAYPNAPTNSLYFSLVVEYLQAPSVGSRMVQTFTVLTEGPKAQTYKRCIAPPTFETWKRQLDENDALDFQTVLLNSAYAFCQTNWVPNNDNLVVRKITSGTTGDISVKCPSGAVCICPSTISSSKYLSMQASVFATNTVIPHQPDLTSSDRTCTADGILMKDNDSIYTILSAGAVNTNATYFWRTYGESDTNKLPYWYPIFTYDGGLLLFGGKFVCDCRAMTVGQTKSWPA